MMRSLASMKGSQFSMQRLEEILRDKVTRQGYGSGAEKIAYEMCQEMQVYMQQAQRNERLMMQQQQVENDSRKQSEQIMLKALGNQG